MISCGEVTEGSVEGVHVNVKLRLISSIACLLSDVSWTRISAEHRA